MKFFYELLPILGFFILYKFYGIYIATTFAISAMVLQAGYTVYRKRRLDTMQLVSLVMVLLLGGATLFFKNELFIKLKPTVVYWILAAIFGLSPFFFQKKPLIQTMLATNISLPDEAWYKLNSLWLGFFTLMGILNLLMAFYATTDNWVTFKLFGSFGGTLVFIALQAVLISRWSHPKALPKN